MQKKGKTVFMFDNTDSVEIISYDKDGLFLFSNHGEDDHIRMTLPLNSEDRNYTGSCLISVKFTISIETGDLTHCAIVDTDVHQGRLIEVNGSRNFSDSINICGVFSNPQDEVIIILTTKGKTTGKVYLENIQLTPLPKLPKNNSGVNVLFYIEPWVERDNVLWKEDYIWWFGHLENALNSTKEFNYNFFYLTGESLASKIQNEQRAFDAKHGVISTYDLRNIFASPEEALSTWMHMQVQHDMFESHKEQISKMQGLVEKALSGFVPDIIFSISPAPYLKELYTDSLILYYNALYARAPWPELHFFDPKGYIATSSFKQQSWRKITTNKNTIDSIIVANTKLFLDEIQTNNQFEEPISIIREAFDNVLLLPLQELNFQSFYPFLDHKTQFSYILDCLSKLPNDVALLVIQHPAAVTIDSASLNWMEQQYENLFFLNGNSSNITAGPSQLVIPLVDGLITASSGLAFQALMWKKRVYLSSKTYLSPLPNAFSLESFSKDSCDLTTQEAEECDQFLYWFLTQYAFSGEFLYKENWLHDRLLMQLNEFRSGALAEDLTIPIANDFSIIQVLENGKRDIPNVNLNSENDLKDTERLKYEKAYTLQEYRHERHAINLEDIKELLSFFRVLKGKTIVDVGCGNGHLGSYLIDYGYKTLGIDIVSAALTQENIGKFPFIVGSIWELNNLFRTDYFHCVDVMEHIPPEKVKETLRVISNNVKHGGIFTICLREDGLGKLIGEKLHMTIEDKHWWYSQLKKSWPYVTEIRSIDIDPHVTFIVSHRPQLNSIRYSKFRFSPLFIFIKRLMPNKIKAKIKECLLNA